METQGCLGGGVAFYSSLPTASLRLGPGWGQARHRGASYTCFLQQGPVGCWEERAMGQGSGLAGELGKLPAALRLSFPIICEIKGWDSTSGFQISRGFVSSSIVQWSRFSGRRTGRDESPARRGARPAPPRPAGSLGCREHCWAPVAWLLWCSPSPLASCDSPPRQQWPGSVRRPRPRWAPSCQPRASSLGTAPPMRNTLRFPERPALSCSPVSSHLLSFQSHRPLQGSSSTLGVAVADPPRPSSLRSGIGPSRKLP